MAETDKKEKAEEAIIEKKAELTHKELALHYLELAKATRPADLKHEHLALSQIHASLAVVDALND